MKATVIGCGEMGEVAVRDLYQYGDFEEIVIATRNPEAARAALGDLSGGAARLAVERVRIEDGATLEQVLRGSAVALNCAGPNYKHEVAAARAAIAAGVSLVDINDDYETTREMLALDQAAREAGVLIVLGLGASPGLNNVLVRAAADQLDSVEEIHTAWVMSAADPGGPALAYHLIHSLSDLAYTVENGRLVEVRSFVDGREWVEFPAPVGTVPVFHIGHPEPMTLFQTFPEARHICDKATFLPDAINDWILVLGRLHRESPGDIMIDGRAVSAEDFAAAYLRRKCKSLPDISPDGALRVEVVGLTGGVRRHVFFTSAGRIARGTGIPAAAGAIMLAQGKIRGMGVQPPESCLDAAEFLYELFHRRHAGQLNGWVEDE